jgi:exosome complex RNA-binding protein Csl4
MHRLQWIKAVHCFEYRCCTTASINHCEHELGFTSLLGQRCTMLHNAAHYQDVRATEIDKVDMTKCFRPGDIVKAKVISLGDARQYYLSTAAAECGVRWAKSEAGAIMTPLSWQEMQCPLTGAKESRKCAKPDA